MQLLRRGGSTGSKTLSGPEVDARVKTMRDARAKEEATKKEPRKQGGGAGARARGGGAKAASDVSASAAPSPASGSTTGATTTAENPAGDATWKVGETVAWSPPADLTAFAPTDLEEQVRMLVKPIH